MDTVWWCDQHGHSAYLKLQPDRGCWAENVDGKGCQMVQKYLLEPTARALIDALQGIAAAYGQERTAEGTPMINFAFYREDWDFEGDGDPVVRGYV